MLSMRTIEQINDQLTLASPVATDYVYFLRFRKFSEARKLIKEQEGHWLSDEEIDLLIEHDKKRFTAKSMELFRVSKKEIDPYHPGKDTDEITTKPKYLVRVADLVFVSRAFVMREAGKIEFIHEGIYYPLSKVEDLFEIRLS
jgi:hypothetical protein